MSASPRALSSHKKPRKRSVYVVARPLSKAGPFSFLSEGKFPLCHWALLVSEHGHVDLRDRVNRLAPDTASWGTGFELHRMEDKNAAHLIKEFGPAEFLGEWSAACVAYVGKTESSDHILYIKGTFYSLAAHICSH